MKLIAWILICLLFTGVNAANAVEPVDASDCDLDSQAIPGFLKENDAGISQAQAQDGRMAELSVQMDNSSEQACLKSLTEQLQQYRNGHLFVKSVAQSAVVATAGASLVFKRLAPSFYYLKVPNFSLSMKLQLDRVTAQFSSLQVKRLILDLRGNGGGFDAA